MRPPRNSRRPARLAAIALAAMAVAAMAVALAGCTGAPVEKPGPDEVVVTPTGPGQVMVAARYVGGFTTWGWTRMLAPRVVVYSDGRAIADANRVLTLSRGEVEQVTRDQRRDLGGFGPRVGSAADADAPTGVLQVRTAAGDLQEVRAYGLGLDIGDYPRELVAAWNRLDDLAQRVKAGGAAYTSNRVRLVAEAQATGDAVTDWPAAVPVPPITGPGPRVAELDAAAIAVFIQSMPPVYEQSEPWPVLRLPDGSLVGVAWRYLLPDE